MRILRIVRGTWDGVRRRMAATTLTVVFMGAVACAPPPTHPFTDRTPTALSTTCESTAGPPPSSVLVANRRATLVAPAGWQPGVHYPLLVSLHPFVVGPADWESYSGLGAAASARGYFVLIPRGSDPGPRWAIPGGLSGGPDDIGWIDALIGETSRRVCLSDTIVAAGFSAGAAMAMALSCELPWRFAAVAASGGSNLTDRCPPGRGGPVDTMILHGRADPIAPLSGSEVIFAPPLGLELAVVVDDAAARNGCRAPVDVPVTSTVVVHRFPCDGARLEYWDMVGAGHTWAGASIDIGAIAGPTDMSIRATDVVLDFFDAHPAP